MDASSSSSTSSKKRLHRRVSARTDGRALEATLKISSLLLWLSYTLAALYVAYCSSFFLEGGDRFMPVHGLPGNTTGAAAALLHRATLSHKYSAYYYYFFPAGFDIAAYVPLVTRVLTLSAAAVSATYLIANHIENGGELLMALSWVVGVLSDHFWLTSALGDAKMGGGGVGGSGGGSSNTGGGSISGGGVTGMMASGISNMTSSSSSIGSSGSGVMVYDSRVPTVPGWMWLVVAICCGFFSGLMCKVKDISDGKLESGGAAGNILGVFDGDDDDEIVRFSPTVGGGGAVSVDGDDDGNGNGDGTAASPPTGGVVGRRRRRRRRRAGGGPMTNMMGIGERVYMVVPFCTGQWFAFIIRHGWPGVFVENGVLILTLGMIGYTMLSFKLLRRQVYRASGRTTVIRYRRTIPASVGPDGAAMPPVVVEEEELVTSVDLIDLISKIFTTSFGAVAVGVVGVNVFITTLAIPFLKALFQLNALVSSVGILVELLVYEMV